MAVMILSNLDVDSVGAVLFLRTRTSRSIKGTHLYNLFTRISLQQNINKRTVTYPSTEWYKAKKKTKTIKHNPAM